MSSSEAKRPSPLLANRFHVKHPPPPALRHLEERLRALETEGLLRTRPRPVEEVARTFCSNDYLGLGAELGPTAPTGAGGSRLIVGERAEHLELERSLAGWLGTSAALVFSSGYAANLGSISALAEPGDLIVSDELNHASIIDGCRLSRARVEVVKHLDLGAVARALQGPYARRRWVVTESYFSMDGDTPDLAALRRLCDEADAGLIVDEAHALGVFGPAGRGLCAERGVTPDVFVGALGKAFGAAGAFVAGSDALIAWLWNRARSFVFSTGVSPATAAAARRSLRSIEEDERPRRQLHENARRLREGLARIGLHPGGHGPIMPVVVGDSRKAVEAAAELREEGIHVQAVRPPTVPAGTARLRITTTAVHSAEEIDHALRAFARVFPCRG
jgi:8-amino-7-oxononanoate synthase